jgi:hypothetical protein
VTRESETELVVGNPASIVEHANQPSAAGFDFELDAVSTRVERILDELLDDRSRPLDDLARGNLIDEL